MGFALQPSIIIRRFLSVCIVAVLYEYDVYIYIYTSYYYDMWYDVRCELLLKIVVLVIIVRTSEVIIIISCSSVFEKIYFK